MFACEIQSLPNDWIQNPSFIAKTEIQHLESEFHGVTFRLQDCLALFNMGGNRSPWAKLLVITAYS